MAIKFNSFSHYSKYDGDLPAYDITPGDNVGQYWKSPYDPKLWYLSNLSTAGDWSAYGGILTSTSSDGRGIRYPRFLREGNFNDISIRRESGEPELSAGSSSSSFITVLPAKTCFYGTGTFYIIDWKYLYASGDVVGAGQFPRRKMLKYGRLYFQFEGGFGYNRTSDKQINSPVSYSVGINTLTGNSEATIFHPTATAGTQQPYTYAGYPNEPEIWIFDARFSPGSDLSILRESEQYKINASGNAGNDMAGHMVGITTRQGFHYLDDFTLATNGSQGQYWGVQAKGGLRGIYPTVGHSNFWGLNMYVGCGDMYMNHWWDSGEVWDIDGGRPYQPSSAYLLLNNIGINGGHYCPGSYSTSQYDNKPARQENYQHQFEGYQPMVVIEHDRFIYYDDTRTEDDQERLCVFENEGMRLRSIMSRLERMDNFAVGNGRIYTCKFETKTTLSGGLLAVNAGARPYWPTAESIITLTSEYSVEIRDISGTLRKNMFSFTGGSVLNDQYETTTYESESSYQKPTKWAFADRIAAGCGRVVFAQTFSNTTLDHKLTYGGDFGKAWLYTEDGAFIKSLSFMDDQWGAIGASLNKDIEFGTKIEIKNNLIFILAPHYDMSQYVSYFGGKGRMYIYSLDGELLAAFSPINLGFTTQGSIVNFSDFVTDGVDLYLIDNQYPYAEGGAANRTHGVLASTGKNALGNQIYGLYSGCPIVHLKLPESLTSYYDKITEMYRY